MEQKVRGIIIKIKALHDEDKVSKAREEGKRVYQKVALAKFLYAVIQTVFFILGSSLFNKYNPENLVIINISSIIAVCRC